MCAQDKIVIEALQIDTVIGVYPFEKTYPQRLYLDLELAWDIRKAAQSDELADTLNYAAVCERLRGFAAGVQYQLLEVLLEKMAELLHQEFGIAWMRLHIRKPSAVAEAASVGVKIERSYEA
ncbi:dihydroneopterin aldolase [Hahella sp. CCB-MM4]|uniref:dihydroneopterin aldolase n=1 Tax=Hahella sp. (strain CCB-MM4) TaxID=1926491 RepID=UPI000B9B36C9|nr:dihydroneopterin aldolase [Hahella sp. CCB-MM4]OZG70059.1 dihydroneopterin aldolase [Hahella sp. CCB-MM4]